LVELKNGETYNGHLVSCDTWMNVHLREVICTSKVGDSCTYKPNSVETHSLRNRLWLQPFI
jgi:small nuclear ribonucleoprotein (snRNP)-like protein